METESASGTFEAMIASTNNPQEACLDGKAQDRDLVVKICDLKQTLFVKNVAWNDLHTVTMTSSFAQDFRVTMLLLHFRTLLNHALSLCLAGTRHVPK